MVAWYGESHVGEAPKLRSRNEMTFGAITSASFICALCLDLTSLHCSHIRKYPERKLVHICLWCTSVYIAFIAIATSATRDITPTITELSFYGTFCSDAEAVICSPLAVQNPTASEYPSGKLTRTNVSLRLRCLIGLNAHCVQPESDFVQRCSHQSKATGDFPMRLHAVSIRLMAVFKLRVSRKVCSLRISHSGLCLPLSRSLHCPHIVLCTCLQGLIQRDVDGVSQKRGADGNRPGIMRGHDWLCMEQIPCHHFRSFAIRPASFNITGICDSMNENLSNLRNWLSPSWSFDSESASAGIVYHSRAFHSDNKGIASIRCLTYRTLPDSKATCSHASCASAVERRDESLRTTLACRNSNCR